MKRIDLIVGEHYALGSVSKMDRWKRVEAELLPFEEDGKIRIKLIGDATRVYGLNIGFDNRSPGSVHILSSAIVIRELWSRYEPRLNEHLARVNSYREDLARMKIIAHRIEQELIIAGVDSNLFTVDRNTWRFTFHADALDTVLDTITRNSAR